MHYKGQIEAIELSDALFVDARCVHHHTIHR